MELENAKLFRHELNSREGEKDEIFMSSVRQQTGENGFVSPNFSERQSSPVRNEMNALNTEKQRLGYTAKVNLRQMYGILFYACIFIFFVF